jgi:hypothetical protein
MKRIKIGLFPHSSSLQSPADRRRLVSWAKKRGHKLLLYETKGIDLIFLSEGCDFLRYSRVSTAPKIFDLIDGYLGLQGDYSDITRGVAKSILRKHQTYPRAYSSIVQETCRNVDLVICSSPEQKVTVLPFNPHVEVILDNHAEIPDLPFRFSDNDRGSVALWEGTPHTLKGLENLVAECDSLPDHINIVTDLTYFKYMNRYLKFDTASRLRQSFGSQKFNLTSWSVANLVNARDLSNLSLIPVNPNDGIQALKPENRLLIMFKLGIPTLTSNIASYSRIERLLNFKFTCKSWEDWGTKISDLMRNPEIGEHQINLGKRYLAQFHNEDLLFDAWDRAIQRVL